jgi:KaiC/GvpD/RAD55 family RecA-like ATPase
VDVDGIAEVLAPFWTDGQRDNLSLALQGTLLRAGLDTDRVAEIKSACSGLVADDQSHKSAEKVARDLDAGKRVPGGHALKEIVGQEVFAQVMRLAGMEDYKDPNEPFSTDLVMSAGAFLKLDLPKRDPIIEELLYAQNLIEIHGARGVGKTWFVLLLLKAIANGSQFLGWVVPKRRRVLYVDGEMAGNQLQERMRDLFGSSIPEYFELMASEIFYQSTDSSLVINLAAQQIRFEGLLDDLKALDRNPEVIVFDNLSALTSGIDENSSSDFQILKSWFTRLRHMGYSVIFVHHTGKTGDQRGTSAREDNLDMTIELTEFKS